MAVTAAVGLPLVTPLKPHGAVVLHHMHSAGLLRAAATLVVDCLPADKVTVTVSCYGECETASSQLNKQ